MIPITAWAIKAPDGTLRFVRGSRNESISAYLTAEAKPWEVWSAYFLGGYRCVRVTVTEVQE